MSLDKVQMPEVPPFPFLSLFFVFKKQHQVTLKHCGCVGESIADVELVLVQLSLQVADQRVDAFLQVLQVDPVAQHRANVLDLHVRLVGVLFRQTRRQDVLAHPLVLIPVLRWLHAARTVALDSFLLLFVLVRRFLSLLLRIRGRAWDRLPFIRLHALRLVLPFLGCLRILTGYIVIVCLFFAGRQQKFGGEVAFAAFAPVASVPVAGAVQAARSGPENPGHIHCRQVEDLWTLLSAP